MKLKFTPVFFFISLFLFQFSYGQSSVNFDDPNNFVRIGHICSATTSTGTGNGRIEVLEYNLPLHTSYYWEDTGLPGDRIKLDPGIYNLIIVKLDGCLEIYPYEILHLPNACTIEYEIKQLDGCCYNELIIKVKKNGILLNPNSYRIQWQGMPGISSNSITYFAYTQRTFNVNVQLNNNCCNISQQIITPARLCPAYYSVPPTLQSLPPVKLNNATFTRRGNQTQFDLNYISLLTVIDPKLCKTLIDIRNKRLRIWQFGVGNPNYRSLVPVKRTLTFKNVPEFTRIKQGTVINLISEPIDTSRNTPNLYRQSEFEKFYNINDTSLFELVVSLPDTTILNQLPPPTIGNEEIDFVVEIDNPNTTVYYASREPVDPVDYFETRDENGFLIEMIKYYYGFTVYNSAGGNYLLSRVPDYNSPTFDIYKNLYMDFLRKCECPETTTTPLLSAVEESSIEKRNDFFLYPNPTNVQSITLELESRQTGTFEMDIITTGGYSLLRDKWEGIEGFDTKRVFIDYFVPGVYIVKIKFPDNTTYIKKLVVL